jgi:hypothetical protein
LIEVGVLGLDLIDALDVALEWRVGDAGVTGVVLRKVLTGVMGLGRTGLNDEVVVTRGFDTEEDLVAFPLCTLPGGTLLVFLHGGCFLRDSNCRSLASRRLSFVLPERLNDGVCKGMDLAVGGVLIPVNSLAVPKLMF